jgi:hypothetical protein
MAVAKREKGTRVVACANAPCASPPQVTPGGGTMQKGGSTVTTHIDTRTNQKRIARGKTEQAGTEAGECESPIYGQEGARVEGEMEGKWERAARREALSRQAKALAAPRGARRGERGPSNASDEQSSGGKTKCRARPLEWMAARKRRAAERALAPSLLSLRKHILQAARLLLGLLDALAQLGNLLRRHRVAAVVGLGLETVDESEEGQRSVASARRAQGESEGGGGDRLTECH